jgi:hypothetical protein
MDRTTRGETSRHGVLEDGGFRAMTRALQAGDGLWRSGIGTPLDGKPQIPDQVAWASSA